MAYQDQFNFWSICCCCHLMGWIYYTTCLL